MNQKQLLENRIKSLKNSININRVAFNSNKAKFLEYAEKELQEQKVSDLIGERVTKFEVESLKTKTKIHIDTKGKITEFLNKFKIKNFAIGTSAIALVVGGLTITASAGALPGDPLYSIKLSMEKLQVALTLNKQDNLRLQVDITGKRIEELSKIVANKNADKNTVNNLVSKIEKDLSNIPDKVSSINDTETKANELADAANMVDDKMSEYSDKLKETKKVAQSNGLDSISNDIDNIGIKGNHVSVKTLNIVVQNINTNNLDEKARQNIVDRVGKKIDNIKDIVKTEESNANLTTNQESSYGYGVGGTGTNLIAQLDDMKEQLKNAKVGSASVDELSILMKDIDKKLTETNLVIVNANDKLNDALKNAIDLNKQNTNSKQENSNYGYANTESKTENKQEENKQETSYGYGEQNKETPEVKAEGMVDHGYGEPKDYNGGSMWSPEE